MQLFITPSKNILMTAISLGSTMIWLVVIIGILQYREKVSIWLNLGLTDHHLILLLALLENGRKRAQT